ncbi:FAD/NAD(P)-binding domain-containing protein [Cadophora sp. DSE1049]|nr:FAD/NAD(P)-binding domain-containing protein [Cadophora sp. DSE1049]
MESPTPIKLNILMVGAGIAGLTAVTALRAAGHKITIFESSTLLNEVGAAITLAPNGSRVLSHLGFDFEAAKGVRVKAPSMYFGDTLEERKNPFPASPFWDVNVEDLTDFPNRSFHRVDLHNGLKNLAFRDGGDGSVEVFLGVKIVKVDVENAEIELDDARVWKGDLMIGADGIHSCVRKAALEYSGETEDIEELGWDISRWLLDRKDVEEDDELRQVYVKGNDRSVWITPHKGQSKRLVWYTCRNGEVQNMVALIPTSKGEAEPEPDLDKLLEQFSNFHPSLLKLFTKAETIKTWRLRNRNPIKSFVYGKTILIGDAAHPNLPFNGQGGNQALEDCAVLQELFTDISSNDAILEKMKLFNMIRLKRASRIQISSGVPGSQVNNLSKG